MNKPEKEREESERDRGRERWRQEEMVDKPADSKSNMLQPFHYLQGKCIACKEYTLR